MHGSHWDSLGRAYNFYKSLEIHSCCSAGSHISSPKWNLTADMENSHALEFEAWIYSIFKKSPAENELYFKKEGDLEA